MARRMNAMQVTEAGGRLEVMEREAPEPETGEEGWEVGERIGVGRHGGYAEHMTAREEAPVRS